MKVCLAGYCGWTVIDHYLPFIEDKSIYTLQSFFDYKSMSEKKHREIELFIKKSSLFILDSGAFSFFGNNNTEVDWDSYISNYCDFINKHKIKNFIELDIDNLVGIKEVERIREVITQKTGLKPIPVWRPSRGLKYWDYMIKNFSFVAISASGKYDSSWTRGKDGEVAIKKLTRLAAENNCKVHGLGYTSITKMKYTGFYSVDSTAWLSSQKFGGAIKLFNPNQGNFKTIKKQNGLRLKQSVRAHQFNEWIKFQKYANNKI
tara:strand:- start:2462 stop:3244 length:783 start_codon:yes stop_codon:yes gene_type:complete